MQWSVKEAKREAQAAKKIKARRDELYREAVELTVPDRENFTDNKNTQKAAFNWDSTAGVNLMRAASQMTTDYTPKDQKWVGIRPGELARILPPEYLKEQTGGSLDDLARKLEATAAFGQAVTHGPTCQTASFEMYVDWLFGQGGMDIITNNVFAPSPITFRGMSISTFVTRNGPFGVDRVFMWHEMDPRMVGVEWPDAKLPDEFKQNIDNAKMDNSAPKDVKLVQCRYYDYDERGPNRWRHEVFWFGGTSDEGGARVVERQHLGKKCVTPRYSAMAGEEIGRGPVIFALPDIRTANKIVEMTLRSAAIAISGVYTQVRDGVLSPVAIKPLSVIKVESNGGTRGPSLQRLDTPQRLDFGEVLLEKLHESIQKVLGDRSLPSQLGPVRSATEFIERVRELMSDQAGGLARMDGEYIAPLFQEIIDAGAELGIVPERVVLDGFLVEGRVNSPLTQNAAMQEATTLVRFVEILKMLVGDQGAMMTVNMERFSQELMKLMGIAPKIANTEAERKDIMKGMAAMMAVESGGDPEQAAGMVEGAGDGQQN